MVDRKQLALVEQVQVAPQARAGPSTSYSRPRNSRPTQQQRPHKMPKTDDKVLCLVPACHVGALGCCFPLLLVRRCCTCHAACTPAAPLCLELTTSISPQN